MSEQARDLRSAVRIAARRKIIVGIFVALGLLAGVGYAMLRKPMFVSSAVVVVSPSVRDSATQVVIADSTPVLEWALKNVDRGMPLGTLRSRLQVKSLTFNAFSISFLGTTAVQAESTANAIAASYVKYISSGKVPGPVVQAQVLERASRATSTSLPIRLATGGGTGFLLGLILGVIAALAVDRSDKRLRDRDQISESVGLPVLASIWVPHPSSAAGWSELLASYEPGAVEAWRLRKALQLLSLADGDVRGSCIGVLSLSCDRKALALGPQLAAFAASLGTPTALVIGPQQDAKITATLRSACAAQTSRSGMLRLIVSDQADAGRLPGATLTIAVCVVDGDSPKVAQTMRTTTTVLGVSAGAVTAEQLARVASSAAEADRSIVGILVADPDQGDQTTGQIPLARPAQRRMPTRATVQ